jgi:hypothetical protein
MRLLDQLVSLVGAALVLAAYVALQRGWLPRETRAYNALNFVGSSLLTYAAVRNWNLGFVLLEGAWAFLSLPGTIRPNRESRQRVPEDYA